MSSSSDIPSTSKWTCDICQKLLTTKSHRDLHRMTVHPLVEPFYKCAVDGCNASFAFPMELYTHKKSMHCGNYKCCEIEFAYERDWILHQFRYHYSYEIREKHAAEQLDGENYLVKIYLLVHVNGQYFKIGYTKNTISHKRAILNTSRGENMLLLKCWCLPEIFEQKHIVKALETHLHSVMLEHGFKQLPSKQEYFYFNNRDLEEKLIEDMMSTTIEEHRQQESATCTLPTTNEPRVEPPAKGVKRTKNENPTQKQINKRNAERKRRAKHKAPRIYCAFNGDDIVKLGHTTTVTRNWQTRYGKFSRVGTFIVGAEYDNVITRKELMHRISNVVRTHFELIDDSGEYFRCVESQHARLLGMIETVIKTSL